MTEVPLPPSHGNNSPVPSEEGEKRAQEEKKTETTVFSLPEKEEASSSDVKLEETLPIEQDGDFFWILQRILWGILKTGFILGLIALTIWLVWRPEKTGEEETSEPAKVAETNVPIKLSKETPTAEKPAVETEQKIPVTGTLQRGAVLAGEWAEWMEKVDTFEQGHPFVFALDWLKSAFVFFQVPTEELIRGDTKEERQVRIDGVLSQMWKLIDDSYRLRLLLQQELSTLTVTVSEEQDKVSTAENAFLASFRNFDARTAQIALDQNIEAQKALVENKSNLEAKKLALSNMEQYDKFLRNMYQNIRANRTALIENIQIVFFPNDPFHQILTPAEWQGKQGQ